MEKERIKSRFCMRAVALVLCVAFVSAQAELSWAQASPERYYDPNRANRNIGIGLPKTFENVAKKQQDDFKWLSELFSNSPVALELSAPAGTRLERKNIAEYAYLFDAAVLADVKNYVYGVNEKNQILDPSKGTTAGGIQTFNVDSETIKKILAHLKNGKTEELLNTQSVKKLTRLAEDGKGANLNIVNFFGKNLLVVVDEAPQAKNLAPASSSQKKEVSKVANRENLKVTRTDFKAATRYVYKEAGPYQMIINDGRSLGAGLDKKFAVVACQNGKVFGVQVYERKKGADGLYQMTDEVIFPNGADIDATIMDKREIGYVRVKPGDKSIQLDTIIDTCGIETCQDSIQVYTFGKQVGGKMKYPEQITCSYRRNGDGSTSVYKAIYSNNHANHAFGIDKICVTAYDSEGKPFFYYEGGFYESTLNDRAFRKENHHGSYTGATDYWPRSIGGVVYTEFDKEGRPLSGYIVGENGIKGPDVTNLYYESGTLANGAAVMGQCVIPIGWNLAVRDVVPTLTREEKPVNIENTLDFNADNPINLKKGLSWDEAVVSFGASLSVGIGNCFIWIIPGLFTLAKGAILDIKLADVAKPKVALQELIETKCIPFIDNSIGRPDVKSHIAFKSAVAIQSLNLPTITAAKMINSLIPFAQSLERTTNNKWILFNGWGVSLGTPDWETTLSALAIITKDYPGFKEKIINELNLTKAQAQIYRDFGVILISKDENRKIPKGALEVIRNFLAVIRPEILSRLGVLVYMTPKDEIMLSASGYCRCYGDIAAVGDATVLFHELGHVIHDTLYLGFTRSYLYTLFGRLHELSGKDIENYWWAAYGMENVSEDFATIIEAWGTDSVSYLNKALALAQRGKPIMLQKFLVAAEVFSFEGTDGKEYTRLFKTGNSGITYEDVLIERDESGVIFKIKIGDNIDIEIKPELIMKDAWGIK